MTWYAAGESHGWLISGKVAFAALFVLAACAEPTQEYSLTVTAPAADQALSMADDMDAEAAGLQYDVMVQGKGLLAGSTVRLFVGGSELATTELDDELQATFPAVTLPPGEVPVVVQSKTGLVSSVPDHHYIFPWLEIVSPSANVTLADDIDSSSNGIQVQVEAIAYAVADEVSLWLDGEVVDTQAPMVDAGGGLLFAITLAPGQHTLQLSAGELYSAELTVSVDDVCGVAQLLAPRAVSGATTVTLGGASGTCPTSGAFTTPVEIATTVRNGATAELWVNGKAFGTATVDNAAVAFADVPLDRRDGANKLSVHFDVEGQECQTDFELDIMVDCAGPDCSIASPEGFAVTTSGKTTSYLNASMMEDGAVAVDVQSSAEMEGRTVELIVDGNSRSALEVTAEAQAEAAVAHFAAVELSDGAHTVEARCEDAEGNVTYSQAVQWMVDTEPCSVVINSPESGDSFGITADVDSELDGTQVLVQSTVHGDDCNWVRTASCDTDTETLSGDLLAYPADGEHTATLDDDLLSQHLCVEVLDVAHNAAMARVGVQFFHPQAVCGETHLVSPAAGSAQIITLGGGDGTCSDTEAYTTDIVVATGAADGLPADLYVNGALAASALVAGGELTFVDVPLDRRDRANTLMVQVHAPSQDCSTSLEVGLMVDCGGHDCSISSPTPLVVDAGGVLTSYLNADHGDGRFNIGVASSVEARGEVVQLIIDGDTAHPISQVAQADSDGSLALFSDVVLDDGVHSVQARCLDSDGVPGYSRLHTWTVDTLGCDVTIDSPAAGTSYTPSDDAAPLTMGTQVALQATVVGDGCDLVRTAACENDEIDAGDWSTFTSGEAVSVTLDDSVVPQSLCIEVKDVAGNGSVASVPVEFFNPTCGSIALVSPRASAGQLVTLGGADGSCPESGPYTTTVEVATEAGEGSLAHLYVNGALVASTQVRLAVATFTDVVLDRRDSENTLAVEIEAGDQLCQKTFDLDVYVDCDGPDCSITSPEPYLVQDGNDTIAYLNSSHGDGEFEVQVETSAEMIGRSVELIIDGNSRAALRVSAQSAASAALATFANVALSDGLHTLEARCVDSQGNETYSAESHFTVDTEPCVVDVTDPSDGSRFLLADDVNLDVDGTQVNVSATATGNCSEVRAGPCDPDVGLGSTGCNSSLTRCGVTSSTSFEPYTSGQVLSVTLDSGLVEQDLCVEIKDVAGNIGLGSTAVEYFHMVPEVAILSPEDGSLFNRTGDDSDTQTFLPDENLDLSGCQASFRVECSEIGESVELVRVPSAVGSDVVLGTSECQAAGVDDTDITAGYGIATFVAVSFQNASDPNATYVARQTYVGDSGEQVGESVAISLSGQCSALTLQYSAFLDAGFKRLTCPDTVGPGAGTFAAQVTTAPQVSATATVTFTAVGGAEQELSTLQNGIGSFYFPGLSAGTTEGETTFSVEVVDTFNNRATTSCGLSVSAVDLELTVAVADPPNTTTFGPTTSNSCLQNGAQSYAVPVLFTPDAVSMAESADRALSYDVDGGTAVNVALADTLSPVCVPVPEGTSVIQGRLSYTKGSAVKLADPLSVTVQSLQIDAPLANTEYFTADSGCTGLSARVQATVASYYADGTGVDVAVQQGGVDVATYSGEVLSGAVVADAGGNPLCVPLVAGQQTIALSIGSSGASASVDVAATEDPTGEAIALVATAPDSAADNYRTLPVRLTWTLPSTGYYSFSEYQLRCHVSPLTPADPILGATEEEKSAWWATAKPPQTIDAASGEADRFVPDGLPPVAAGDMLVNTGERTRYCALRACDELDRCTAIPDTTVAVAKAFREQSMDNPLASAAIGMGRRIEPVGDVNGDGFDDVLVSASIPATAVGTAAAYLYFGRDSGGTAPSPSAVEITHPLVDADERDLPFAQSIAGLGDVNGDGRPDFAIGFPGMNTLSGRVYVFLGRQAQDPWPSVVALSASDCGADMCITPATPNFNVFGSAVSGVGNFDGSGPNDIAIGSEGDGFFLGAAYVLLGVDGDLACDAPSCAINRAGDFFGAERTVDGGTSVDFDGFYVQGPSGNPFGDPGVGFFGKELYAVGKTGGDSDDFDDLLVMRSSGGEGEIWALAGRGYTPPASGRLENIAFATLPQLLAHDPLDSNTTIALVGDVWSPPGAAASTDGRADLAVHYRYESIYSIYPGDSSNGAFFDTSDANRLLVNGPAYTNMGASLCVGEYPGLGWVGASSLDLDGDTLVDMCAGSVYRPSTSAPSYTYPGLSYYFDGDNRARMQSTLSYNNAVSAYLLNARVPSNATEAASVISPASVLSTTATDTAVRNIKWVGDLTGDGQPDLLVGDVPHDPGTVGDPRGGFWLLY